MNAILIIVFLNTFDMARRELYVTDHLRNCARRWCRARDGHPLQPDRSSANIAPSGEHLAVPIEGPKVRVSVGLYARI
jgi:hypothetical protein